MNKPMLSLLVLLSAASTAAFAQQQDMTLQQERDQMGADLEDNRQQIGRDINRIRESDASQNQTQGINRGGVQSDAVNPQPNVPGTANPPGRSRLAQHPGQYAAAQWWCRDCPCTRRNPDSGHARWCQWKRQPGRRHPAGWIGNR